MLEGILTHMCVESRGGPAKQVLANAGIGGLAQPSRTAALRAGARPR